MKDRLNVYLDKVLAKGISQALLERSLGVSTGHISKLRPLERRARRTDLGVTKTHSRPNVSNDNPYSEAQFKTLKYRPDFPERFGFIEDARLYCRRFFDWDNLEHRHSGIGMFTPHDVHHANSGRFIAVKGAGRPLHGNFPEPRAFSMTARW